MLVIEFGGVTVGGEDGREIRDLETPREPRPQIVVLCVDEGRIVRDDLQRGAAQGDRAMHEAILEEEHPAQLERCARY